MIGKKGQINIEFLGAAGLFILTLLGLVTSGQVLPDYSSGMDKMSLNLEAKSLTTEMITEEGYHSYGEGGTDWTRNSSTISSIEGFGLAEGHHEIDRDKLNSIKTATVDGSTAVNYTQFRNATGIENQYNFEFVWLPTVQTNHSYIKGSPPSDPDIFEPETESYSLADNRVHYGTLRINSNKYNFLVTAHNGVYDSVYVNQDSTDRWDFRDVNPEEPYGIADFLTENGFTLETIQNRENDRGAMLILSKKIKEFGPSVNTDTQVATLDRYAVLEEEPLRIEVSVW